MSTGGANGGIYIGAPGTIGAAIARDDRLKLEDQAARQAQAGNIALRSLIGGMQAPGTPATKSYEVNGRTIGQNREASGGMNPATQIGLLNKFTGGPIQSAVASQVIQQLFPQGFTGTVGQDQIAYQNGKVVAEGPKSVRAPDKLPAEAELAKWLFGGNEAAAREYLIQKNSPQTAIKPNSPLAQAQQDLKNGYITQEQYDLISKKETALPAGSGDKTPQKYKDAVAATGALEGAVREYKNLLNKVGTEWWDSTAAARLESLETQMKFGIKGLEQTGALDRGAIEVMGGMIPAATGSAAFDPRGTSKAKAKLKEFEGYIARMKSSLASAYDPEGNIKPSAGASGSWSIVRED